jgi:hypothetical protein
MLDAALAEKGMHATDISDSLLGVQVRMAEQFSDKAPSVPEILKRSLIGPYIDGILLVHFLRRRGGWAEVDRVWHSPPTTTEQLLHPEKLLAHEAALVVAAPPAPEGFPASSAFADVLGEQSLRQLLEEWVPRQTAEADAAGWGGDRLAVFRDHDRVAAAIHLTADTVQDAVRQAQGLSRGVSAQGGTEHGLASCAERSDRGPLRIERRGRDIVIVAGPYRIDGGTARSAGSCSTAAAWSGRIFSGR